MGSRLLPVFLKPAVGMVDRLPQWAHSICWTLLSMQTHLHLAAYPSIPIAAAY